MAKLGLKEWRKRQGLEGEEEFVVQVELWVTASVVPALCSEGCEVEPDGVCPHGGQSVLLRLGLI